MQLLNTTSSPQASLADLFLNNATGVSSGTFLGSASAEVDQTFTQILKNQIDRAEQIKNAAQPALAEDSSAARQPLRPIRKSALEELEDQIEALGVPAESLTLNKDDLGKLEKILEGSGFSATEVKGIMSKLSEGPLTMDRVMAAIGTPSQKKGSALTIGEGSETRLGQFLQELGLDAEEVKDILDSLKAGQDFSADKLRSLITQNSDNNLKDMDLSKVNKENLKELLNSLGLKDDDLKNLWSKMNQSQGKISMEGFLGFLKSAEQTEPLQVEQLENIRQVMKNLLMANGLKPTPQFNRIVSLLQSMGDREIDQDFLNASPALQALRGGAASARAVTEGSASGQGNENNLGQGFTRSGTGESQGQSLTSGSETKTTSESKAFQLGRGALPTTLTRSVANQVAEKMVYQAFNDQHRLKLQLTPQNLGRLSISMVVKESTVTASIVAENPMVKEALETQISQLRENLAAQGLTLGSLDVTTEQDRKGTGPGDRGRGSRSTAKKASTDADQDTEAILTQARTESDGRVDRMI